MEKVGIQYVALPISGLETTLMLWDALPPQGNLVWNGSGFGLASFVEIKTLLEILSQFTFVQW